MCLENTHTQTQVHARTQMYMHFLSFDRENEKPAVTYQVRIYAKLDLKCASIVNWT